MALTKLDDVCALITIDLQKGIAGMPMAHPAAEIIDRSARLARAFRERGLPVVLVNVTAAAPGRTDAGPRKFSFPDDWTELVPELDQQPTDYLRQRGVTQVVLTGIATSAGVESTARNAYDLGYHVTLVVDAMTDRDMDAHRYSVEKVFPRIGETGKTADVLRLLQEPERPA